MQKIWYHGTTSKRKAASIRRTGFRAGSWFARHMEDAVKFGGKYVFSVRVRFDRTPLRWQVQCINEIPASAIDSLHIVEAHP